MKNENRKGELKMEKIKEFLKENGYELLDKNSLDCINKYVVLNFSFPKNKNEKILMRMALLCTFDRWANSGYDLWFNTEEEIIDYLKHPSQYLTKAISEIIENTIIDCEYENDYSDVDRIINILGEGK